MIYMSIVLLAIFIGLTIFYCFKSKNLKKELNSHKLKLKQSNDELNKYMRSCKERAKERDVLQTQLDELLGASRSAKAIGDNIQSKVNEVESKGDPRQGQLFGESPEEKAALDIINNNPDQLITVSRTDPQGNIEEITMTLRDRLDELEAEAKIAEQDVLATQTAISCALQFG